MNERSPPHHDFAVIVSRFRDRFQPCWDDGSIAGIEIDFREFKIAMQTEEPLAAAFVKRDNVNTSFVEGWRLVQGRFVRLRDFCDGIATAYPDISTVESDFSILELEKDDTRLSLTDLSLEGCMKCKSLK